MFDFIEAAEFRQSLEADHAEMQRCADASAWKSVQVLAGSIVEALLIDYLLATKGSRSGAKEPLRMDLAEAISLCKAEGLLNERTADLSSVVRSYRNLIHPGRVVRLGEESPSANSGIIAMKVVGMITAQVESRRRKAFGLTAEQLLAKIEKDKDAIAILKHLLVDVTPPQRARFILDVLPTRFMTLKRTEVDDDDPFSNVALTVSRLPIAYRIVLEAVDDSIKRHAADQFVRVLREEDGETVRIFKEAFFRGEDLAMVADSQRDLVKQHLLSSTPYHRSGGTAAILGGLAPYLTRADVSVWVDGFVRPLGAEDIHEFTRATIRKAFVKAACEVEDDIAKGVYKRLDDWVTHYLQREQEVEATTIRTLKGDIEDDRSLPF